MSRLDLSGATDIYLWADCGTHFRASVVLGSVAHNFISEFRKTVTLLTGFRVDMVGETRQYEVRPSMALKGDVLKFRCSKEGDMELLPTEFAARLSPQIETYLQARPNPPFASISILSHTPT